MVTCSKQKKETCVPPDCAWVVGQGCRPAHSTKQRSRSRSPGVQMQLPSWYQPRPLRSRSRSRERSGSGEIPDAYWRALYHLRRAIHEADLHKNRDRWEIIKTESTKAAAFKVTTLEILRVLLKKVMYELKVEHNNAYPDYQNFIKNMENRFYSTCLEVRVELDRNFVDPVERYNIRPMVEDVLRPYLIEWAFLRRDRKVKGKGVRQLYIQWKTTPILYDLVLLLAPLTEMGYERKDDNTIVLDGTDFQKLAFFEEVAKNPDLRLIFERAPIHRPPVFPPISRPPKRRSRSPMYSQPIGPQYRGSRVPSIQYSQPIGPRNRSRSRRSRSPRLPTTSQKAFYSFFD